MDILRDKERAGHDANQSVFLVQDFEEKREKFLKKRKSRNSEERIGKIKIVDDFLPKPKNLVLKKRPKKT